MTVAHWLGNIAQETPLQISDSCQLTELVYIRSKLPRVMMYSNLNRHVYEYALSILSALVLFITYYKLSSLHLELRSKMPDLPSLPLYAFVTSCLGTKTLPVPSIHSISVRSGLQLELHAGFPRQ
jgi:hypothetical protein